MRARAKWQQLIRAALIAAASTILVLCASPAAQAAQPAATFNTLLAALPTDDNPTSHSGYLRSLFKLWLDGDGNGCNTRAEVLLAETLAAVTKHSTCTIDAGSWYSPYDGITLSSARKVDIDHMVPLKEAWLSGAYAWDAATRARFANDLDYPAALIAVSASSNRSKSDRDPASWMPSNVAYRCEYAATWVAVKYRWTLSVDSAERSALQNTLNGCGEVDVAVPDKTVPTFSASAPANAAAQVTTPVTAGDGSVDPNYGTCAAAHAAGHGPYYQGSNPEYSFYRDRDKDGVVCE